MRRQPAAWPHQVGVIPSRADSFQDRAEADRLRETLSGGGTAIIESADGVAAGGVLTGMGGVGKSQLAAEYARAALRGGEVDVLVWITASSATAVVSGFAQAGVDVLGADPADPEAAGQAFLAWLEPKPGQQRMCRWLVVLDDVADPADVHGWWPPASPHGRTVVTTRRKDAALTGGGRRLIEVGLFTPAQSVAYLIDALAAEPDDQLAALANELGHLPLALSQSAAYLADTGLGCAAYRAMLADRTRALADAAPDVLPDGQTHTTAAAWAISIDHADTLRPRGLARPLLQLAAFLDPNGIPQTVFTSQPILDHLGDQVTAEQAVLALRALYRLSLIDHDSDTPHQTVRVHQLIQRAVRDALTPDQHHQLARTAGDALLTCWPAVERDTTLARALRANTDALYRHAPDALWHPDAHAVLFRAGDSLGYSGQATAAATHFQHLTDTARHRLGRDHPDALITRHDLACWQGEAGNPHEAATTLTQLLTDQQRILGPDHPHTLNTRHNLARLQGEAGDPRGAVTALTQLLSDVERVLVPNHPDALATRRSLAYWQAEAGNPAAAIIAFGQLLADQQRILVPDHPNILKTRHSLARTLGKAGAPVAAATALAQLLTDRERIFGPDHPETLNTRHDLAHWQGEAGNPHEAVTTLTQLLTDQQRILGPDHPHTLNTQHALAYWRERQGWGDGKGGTAISSGDDHSRVRIQQ